MTSYFSSPVWMWIRISSNYNVQSPHSSPQNVCSHKSPKNLENYCEIVCKVFVTSVEWIQNSESNKKELSYDINYMFAFMLAQTLIKTIILLIQATLFRKRLTESLWCFFCPSKHHFFPEYLEFFFWCLSVYVFYKTVYACGWNNVLIWAARLNFYAALKKI